MRHLFLGLMLVGMLVAVSAGSAQENTFNLPDTGQSYCYAAVGGSIVCPSAGAAEFGQDANYQGAQPSYQDNGDGTVTDLVTGLMWQKEYTQIAWQAALDGAAGVNTGGYSDWRVPTIKELYSLINFSGVTGRTEATSIPYVDTLYFDFVYGDESAGQRLIDAQYWSSTQYVSTTMGGNQTVFGVNFADGRIKGYPIQNRDSDAVRFVRYVRGNPNYGVNNFVDNGDGTVLDAATGLTWMQADSGEGLNWAGALAWCENSNLAGLDDWRLPNAHELQSLVDYNASPDTSNSAAIDPLFASTAITNELGVTDYPAYWSSTTHLDGRPLGSFAVYVNFGESLGYFEAPPDSGNVTLQDVHGAGAQRSDPKDGDPAQFPEGNGPQGDVVRITNFARCVRGGNVTLVTGGEIDTALDTLEQGQQPPQEALEACVGLAAGTACTVNTPNGQLTGTCNNTPDGLFACIPAGR